MAGKKNRRTLAAPDRGKQIVVGVTDMRFVNKSSPPRVPAAQVVIFLLDANGTRIAPNYKLPSTTSPAAVFGHFERMQTLFKFHYDKKTFNTGDDRQTKKGGKL